ncbi:MAG: tRNA guanosine(34) transglycosylase Tgt [Planctomycetota bacterium]|jgi:queuine tRNA-ribosyltransferase
MQFTLLKETGEGPRLGRLSTAHGAFETPVFMPVATQGTVKGLAPDRVWETGARAILCNAYHLAIRPGVETVEALGGLHAFMGWNGAIVTDSGGFQIFSLARHRKVTVEGVRFQSPLDGATLTLTPESTLENQARLGADICMPLDQPVPYPASEGETEEGVERTTAWARRTREAADRLNLSGVFGIVQGGTFPALRERSVEETTTLDFAGYALGGMSVGEGPEQMDAVLAHTTPLLPKARPRYLMGVGMPRDILSAVAAGIDMFDCTLPTRNGRNGTVFTRRGNLRLRNAAHTRDSSPIDPTCRCYACTKGFSRGYLRHLFLAGESLAMILCSIHNVVFFQDLMSGIRQAIHEKRFDSFRKAFLADAEGLP